MGLHQSKRYLTPIDPLVIYPYTWEAERIRLTITPYGMRTENEFEGAGLLLHPGRYLVLVRETYAMGFPLPTVATIEMLKRGRWWQLLRRDITIGEDIALDSPKAPSQ